MSRLIKFRVWDKEYKEWKPYCPYDLENGIDFESEDKFHVFQQFTGLLDRHGKEIYEGDVLKSCKAMINGSDTSIVEYENEFGGFNPFTCKQNGEYYMGEWDSENIEIIGNIFENPSLNK